MVSCRRCWFIAVVILAATLCSAQSISYRTVAKPASQIVQDVAKLTHENLEVSPVLAKLILIVDVSDVSGAELKKRMADAVCGSWQAKSDRLMLVADPIARRTRDRRFRQFQTDRIRRGIDALRASGSLNPILKEDVTASLGPLEKATGRLMQQMSPNLFASPISVPTVTFSNVSDGFSNPLKVDCRPLARQLFAEAELTTETFPIEVKALTAFGCLWTIPPGRAACRFT